jgi:putative nucleotidyltransferase with HDIG domain
MDTPADFRYLSGALGRYHIPTFAECDAMLSDTSLFPKPTAAHCRMVGQVARHLGRVLIECRKPLDMDRIEAGALLHDIGKGKKDHGEAGARMLSEMGFTGIADIVSVHMDITLSESSCPTEAEIVYLADKLVSGADLVPLSTRFEKKLAKYGHDLEIIAAIRKRKEVAETIANRIAFSAGKSFQAIMNSFHGASK